MNTFANDANKFSKIANCKPLGFGNAGIKPRTNLHLKDLNRTMLKRGEIIIDPASGQLYYIKATVQQCLGLELSDLTSITDETGSSFRTAQPLQNVHPLPSIISPNEMASLMTPEVQRNSIDIISDLPTMAEVLNNTSDNFDDGFNHDLDNIIETEENRVIVEAVAGPNVRRKRIRVQP